MRTRTHTFRRPTFQQRTLERKRIVDARKQRGLDDLWKDIPVPVLERETESTFMIPIVRVACFILAFGFLAIALDAVWLAYPREFAEVIAILRMIFGYVN